MPYQNILVACDWSEASHTLMQRASEFQHYQQATVHLIHVVELAPMLESSFGPLVSVELDLHERMMQAARQRLNDLAKPLNIPTERQNVVAGSPKNEIIRLARELSAELILIGSHGRHGVGALLGSTATSVIHHAPCDVLAIRL
ncbi:MAG: universal stress protein [Methylococcaceae bacterium]